MVFHIVNMSDNSTYVDPRHKVCWILTSDMDRINAVPWLAY